MTFNPLEHPVCFSYPERNVVSTWTQHVPFGIVLIDLLRPRQLVDLGTNQGVAFCAFCQAVQELRLDCKCFAIDNWSHDEQTEINGSQVLADLAAHHNVRYESFSTLIQSRLDEACSLFTDGSIDLLHINDNQSRDDLIHDFNLWLPKMSEHGVVVLHHIAERGSKLGLWKLWDELKSQYRFHLEFSHGSGLGVAVVGRTVPDGLQSLFDISQSEWLTLREMFHELGERLQYRGEIQCLKEEFRAAKEEMEEQVSEARKKSNCWTLNVYL